MVKELGVACQRFNSRANLFCIPLRFFSAVSWLSCNLPSKLRLMVAVDSPAVFLAMALYKPPSASPILVISNDIVWLLPSDLWNIFILSLAVIIVFPNCQEISGLGSPVSLHSMISLSPSWRIAGLPVNMGLPLAASAAEPKTHKWQTTKLTKTRMVKVTNGQVGVKTPEQVKSCEGFQITLKGKRRDFKKMTKWHKSKIFQLPTRTIKCRKYSAFPLIICVHIRLNKDGSYRLRKDPTKECI